MMPVYETMAGTGELSTGNLKVSNVIPSINSRCFENG